MRLRFDQRLFLSYLLLIVLLVVPISMGAQWQLRRHLLEGVRAELLRELVLARAYFEAAPHVPPDSMAVLLGSLAGHRVTIIDRSGRVRGESSPTPLSQIGNHLLRPEVQEALRGRPGWTIRESETVSIEMLYMAVPSTREGVLRFAVPLSDVGDAIARVQRGVIGIGAVALVLAALFSAGFSLGITRPLRRLVGVARRMAEGDLTHRFGERRRDELGELALALDSLADELQKRLGQLEEERAETQTLIDSMEEGVIALSSEGTVRRANPAARRMFALRADPRGIAPEEVTRRPEFLRMVEAVLGGEPVPALDLTSDAKSLLATAHPLPDGGAVLVFLDVSRLRRLEGMRRDFVANVSHELKTPLTAIRGYSETLRDPELPPHLRERFTSVLHANAERLQHIVDDLLDLSRIEAGAWPIAPAPVALPDAVAVAWAAQEDVAEAKRVSFVTDIASDAREGFADPSSLHQVLTNLFSNALRYSPVDGRVVLRACREPGADGVDWLRIEVADTGPGIPAEHLPRIFERFYRADPARSRAEGGTGLGLAIVKHLVEAQGGRVSAQSTVGEGTTIGFTIPAAA